MARRDGRGQGGVWKLGVEGGGGYDTVGRRLGPRWDSVWRRYLTATVPSLTRPRGHVAPRLCAGLICATCWGSWWLLAGRVSGRADRPTAQHQGKHISTRYIVSYSSPEMGFQGSSRGESGHKSKVSCDWRDLQERVVCLLGIQGLNWEDIPLSLYFKKERSCTRVEYTWIPLHAYINMQRNHYWFRG